MLELTQVNFQCQLCTSLLNNSLSDTSHQVGTYITETGKSYMSNCCFCFFLLFICLSVCLCFFLHPGSYSILNQHTTFLTSLSSLSIIPFLCYPFTKICKNSCAYIFSIVFSLEPITIQLLSPHTTEIALIKVIAKSSGQCSVLLLLYQQYLN